MTVHVKATSSASPERVTRWRASAMRAISGFTLIEVMIVVAIIAVLAAIALPNYSDYIKRGKIIEATTALSDMRTRMEQYFLDNRSYKNGGACGINPAVVEAAVQSFQITCVADVPANGYTVTADGGPPAKGMTGFVYTIDSTNTKTTTGTGTWGASSATCWVTRKDGSCG
jgi:type IV pilus assembly protein PilE